MLRNLFTSLQPLYGQRYRPHDAFLFQNLEFNISMLQHRQIRVLEDFRRLTLQCSIRNTLSFHQEQRTSKTCLTHLVIFLEIAWDDEALLDEVEHLERVSRHFVLSLGRVLHLL